VLLSPDPRTGVDPSLAMLAEAQRAGLPDGARFAPERVSWAGCPTFPGHSALRPVPLVEDVAEVCGHAGFSPARVNEIREPERSVEDTCVWITKMRYADTSPTALTDDEVARGLAALDASAATHLDGSLHLLTYAASP
jgi:hypothetical protein